MRTERVVRPLHGMHWHPAKGQGMLREQLGGTVSPSLHGSGDLWGECGEVNLSPRGHFQGCETIAQ